MQDYYLFNVFKQTATIYVWNLYHNGGMADYGRAKTIKECKAKFEELKKASPAAEWVYHRDIDMDMA